jgi:hypothetical protein
MLQHGLSLLLYKETVMKIYFIYLILLFSSNYYLEAQPNLILTKPGKPHHYFYQVGDKITYKERSTGEKFSGMIISLNDSTLELAHAPRVKISDISVIYRTRHFFAQAAGAGIVILGIYLPISIINRAIKDEHPIVNEDILIVNGTMLAISGISLLFVTHKIRIGDPWKLQVLDFGRPVYD